jgi:predicted metal-dependent phosphoesterase TrpH
MIIDLHIHSKHSDGVLSVEQIVREAKNRQIGLISITDHDSIDCQRNAAVLAKKRKLHYVTGVELNVTFSHPKHKAGKSISLDLLGYDFDPHGEKLKEKLEQMADYREKRAKRILKNLNTEFKKEKVRQLTQKDFRAIQANVDGVLGRPHIADYLVKKGVVRTRQEAFDRYLVKCDVPKYPLHIEEASKLIRNAGGKAVLAHPNDPHGTSLVTLTSSLFEQTAIIADSMLDSIDGLECWHSRNDSQTTDHYVRFARERGLMMTGGSDCHQKPIVMGTVAVPEYVASQFSVKVPI